MKIPAKMRTYCRKCRSHTTHKVSIEKTRQRGGGRSKGQRRKKRHTKGYGNKGRYSKRPISQRSRTSKTTKRVDLRLKCETCGKQWARSRPRAKRVELIR